MNVSLATGMPHQSGITGLIFELTNGYNLSMAHTNNSRSVDLSALDRFTKAGTFYTVGADHTVECYACAHRCRLKPGQRGICQLRHNQNGELRVPWGYSTGLALDPVEKKPFNHFLPGAFTLSFGMLGCNFHCDFCQNWVSAQVLNDPDVPFYSHQIQAITAEQIVTAAIKNHAKIVVSTYNEPLVTIDWANHIFELAHQAGLKTAMVSNGYATPEELRQIHPHLDALKIDLKSSSPETYRSLGGRLDAVIESIALAHQMGIWVEVVTLLIPGFNDTPQEIWQTARLLAEISPALPWHITAFHPDYKMQDRNATTSTSLITAAEIGQEASLQFVYAGNLPGRVGSLEDTYCPNCQKAIIRRRGFSIIGYRIDEKGFCQHCGNPIPGVFEPPQNGKNFYSPIVQ